MLENVCILLTWWILLGFARWGGQWWLSRRSASVGFVGMKLVIMKICEHFVGVLGDSRILLSKMLESSKCSESCSEFVSVFVSCDNFTIGTNEITCLFSERQDRDSWVMADKCIQVGEHGIVVMWVSKVESCWCICYGL